MATTNVKNYNVTPYYDDFDESKGFHRILFKPGVSVQARELTQMQTLLQAQIDRHGKYSFKEGDSVINGEKSINTERDFIKVEFIANKSKIKSMRYETESCILCEASASLLANKINKLSLSELKIDLMNIKKIKANRNLNFPLKFKELKLVLNKKTLKRVNCVILPMEALFKAFKIGK